MAKASENTEKATDEKVVATKKQTPLDQFKEAKTGKGKKVKIEFTASPTGVLRLGYAIGDVAEFEDKQATLIVDLGLGKKV